MSNNIEKIENIKLDLTHYSGEDLYSDGPVEQELLDIVSNNEESDLERIIAEKKDWSVLYHFSNQRENIVSWLPIKKGEKVLEVGSGCGAITGALSRKAGSVTCVDLSKRRSTINAKRHKNLDNITIHVGNFKDIEPDLEDDYDWICLIGVFEYGQSYMGSDTPYHDFLGILKKHVKKKGRIVIAIENKLGLKYFAGCREDHLGTFFSGIEGYKGSDYVRTFSKDGLEKIIRECGEDKYSFYYPYPDYKFPTTIFSDRRLPAKGELTNNIRNFDRDRLLLFDEKKVFDNLIEDGLFPLFSNSHMVVIGEDIEPVYARFSNERTEEKAIITMMDKTEDGIRVKKLPQSDSANVHIEKLKQNYDKLSEKYAGSKMNICRCDIEEADGIKQAIFPYVKGRSLNDVMDECLIKQDMDGFKSNIRKFYDFAAYNSEYVFSDIDMVFSNIIVNDNEWTLIDYEWVLDEKTDAKYQTWRALYCYMQETGGRDIPVLQDIYNEFGISESDCDNYLKREVDFHKAVQAGGMSLAQLREEIGCSIIHPEKYIEMNASAEFAERVQIYTDKGEGYKEEESYFVKKAVFDKGTITFQTGFSGEVKNLRIDPMMSAGAVFIDSLTINGKSLPDYSKKYIECNGRRLRGDYTGYIFESSDPNINLHLSDIELNENNKLEAVFTYAAMNEKAAHGILTSAKRII